MKESMHESAARIISKTFGVTGDYLDEMVLMVEMNYDDTSQGRTGMERMANGLWMNFSGGDTCYNAAKQIENKWIEDGWVK